MLNNKEVLERIENILLDFANSTNDFDDYTNKVEEFMDVMANKTGLYKELIYYLWLDEKVELRENDLKKINDCLDIIENKKNCVNLLTAIVKRFVHIKFDLDDKFTNDFIKNIRKTVESYEIDNERNENDEWLKEILTKTCNNRVIAVRDILFAMSYNNIEEEYNDILKNLMVYKTERD